MAAQLLRAWSRRKRSRVIRLSPELRNLKADAGANHIDNEQPCCSAFICLAGRAVRHAGCVAKRRVVYCGWAEKKTIAPSEVKLVRFVDVILRDI